MRVLLAFLLLAPLSALAQPARGLFPWWETPIVRDLKLSDEQNNQIRSVLRDYRSRMIDQRAAVEKAEAEVEDLFNEDPVNMGKATEAIDRLVAARNELTASYSHMSLKLRSVLTLQQWQELQRRRPMGFPGGPGGRGPGKGPGRGGHGRPTNSSPDNPRLWD